MQRTLLNKCIHCLIVNYDYKIHVSTFRFCYFVFSAECQYKKWSHYFNRAWQIYVVTDFVFYHMCLSIVAMFLIDEVVKKTMLSLTSWLFLNLKKKKPWCWIFKRWDIHYYLNEVELNLLYTHMPTIFVKQST